MYLNKNIKENSNEKLSLPWGGIETLKLLQLLLSVQRDVEASRPKGQITYFWVEWSSLAF